jgi:exonuclease VII large subunit
VICCVLAWQQDKLQRIAAELPLIARYQQREQMQKIEQLEQICQLLSIEGTLQRGFALVSKNGRPVASAQEILAGEKLEIEFKDGVVKSEAK